MLNYAQVREESYYAQNYACIMCQSLIVRSSHEPHPVLSLAPDITLRETIKLSAIKA